MFGADVEAADQCSPRTATSPGNPGTFVPTPPERLGGTLGKAVDSSWSGRSASRMGHRQAVGRLEGQGSQPSWGGTAV